MLGKLLFIVAIILVLVTSSDSVQAEEAPAWGEKPAVLLGQQSAIYDERLKVCQGVRSVVKISGAYKEACLFGGGDMPKIARYYTESIPHYTYAPAFSADFYPLKFCDGSNECVYGQAADTLIVPVPSGPIWMGRAVIRDFSQQLQFIDRDGGYFELKTGVQTIGIGLKNGVYPVGSTGISKDGNWAVVEFHDFGLIRLNLRTLQATRIAAPGVTYGVGNDPTFEMAVSDSGNHIAIVGLRAGVAVHEVRDGCGETADAVITVQFPSHVTPCPQASIDQYTLFPGFKSAHEPLFSVDGDTLAVKVRTLQGVTQAAITPQQSNIPLSKKYFAFGDSFTSGEGEVSDDFYLPDSNTTGNGCHVSIRSYPYLLEKVWNYVVENRACSGATTRETSARFFHMASDRQNMPAVLSLGIGGNDVGLMGKLKTCLGIGTCEWALGGRRAATASEIQSIAPAVSELLNAMKAEYGHSKIALVGYPSIVNSSPSAVCSPLIAAMLDEQERMFMNEATHYLNKVLEATAAHLGVAYIDVEEALVGERLCDASESAMNGVRVGDDIAPIASLADIKVVGAESFHPTPKGHQLISRVIQDNAGFWADTCGSCRKDTTVSDYWTTGYNEAGFVRQVVRSFLYAKDIVKSVQSKFEFLPGSFVPKSFVTLEIHSEPKTLLKTESSEDGSLKGSFMVEDIEQGYHTIHAYGTDGTGKPVEYYDFVYVTEEASGSTEDEKEGASKTIAASSFRSTPHSAKSAVLATTNSIPDNKSNTSPQIENPDFKEASFHSSFIGWFIVASGFCALCLSLSAFYRLVISKRVQSDRL